MSKVNRSLDYLSYLNIWDALFYERIYKHGYPQELPFLPDGTVNHNTWAFMPPAVGAQRWGIQCFRY